MQIIRNKSTPTSAERGRFLRGNAQGLLRWRKIANGSINSGEFPPIAQAKALNERH
jgi:hypothetical protein